MKEEIIKYFSKYVEITEELERAILEGSFIKSYDKGTILLKEGNVSNECYFILKGCIRSYYLKDGDEITIEFYTEEQPVTPSVFGRNVPSEHYLECVEATIASVGTPELESTMFQKYPQLESLTRVISEVIIANYKESFAELKMSTPEERYLNLLKTRPEILQRVPQYQIASYLGIKPESLSRIRKRIMSKQK